MTVVAEEAPTLVTIPNVELVAVGDWNASTGPCTFTAEDLAAAVAALDDPAVHDPRLRIGHTDASIPLEASAGGFEEQPAFGRFVNLRLADNGTKIVADMAGVPAWLAEILPSAYPSRSVEAYFDVRTSAGRRHRLVISSVALLGVSMPAVETLEDLRLAYGAEMPDGLEIVAGSRVTATQGEPMPGRVSMSVTYTDVRRSFYEDFATDESGRYWWWICDFVMQPQTVIADDDEGGLWAVPYTIKGGTVGWGDPVEVRVQYVEKDSGKVAAARLRAVSYQTAGESRPHDRVRTAAANHEQEEADMAEATVSTKLLERLGLPADATEEDALAKLDELENAQDQTDDTDDTDDEPEAEAQEQVAASEGLTVTVDKATFEAMQQDSKLGREARLSQVRAEADTLVDAAKRDGRIAPASAAAWRQAILPDGATELVQAEVAALAKLEKGRIPVDERGGAPNVEQTEQTQLARVRAGLGLTTNQA